MNKVTSLAVVGAGLIGKRHIDQIRAESQAKLHAIVDPSAGARAFATERNAAWFPSFADMLRVGRPDGVIIATPNQLHVSTGLEAIAAKLPCLIENPLAD